MSNSVTRINTSGRSITMSSLRDDFVITSNKDINMTSTVNNINIDSKKCVNITSTDKSINLHSVSGRVNLNANEMVSVESVHGPVSIKSDRDETNIESYEDMNIVSKQGNITVDASNGTLNINALNNVNISTNQGEVYVSGDFRASTISQGLPSGECGLLVPIGTVVPYCGGSSPAGWLLCDGSQYDRIAYNNLFDVIGYTFGGSDDNFNVPDFRGRLPLGSSNGLESFANKNVGDIGGSETHTLTVDEMPSHAHGVTDPGHTHAYLGVTGVANPAVSLTTMTVADDGDSVRTTGSSVTGISINNTGGGFAHSIMQPYLTLNFIIKY